MFSVQALSAQEIYSQHDTLEAAVKTDSRRVAESIGRISVNIEGVRKVVSPLGEGDPMGPGSSRSKYWSRWYDGVLRAWREFGQQPHYP